MLCRLPARHYRVAARLRLGLPAFDSQYTSCVCKSPSADPSVDVHHGLSCHNVRRTLVNKRHDNVKNLVHMWAKHVGCAAVKEPQNKAGTQERADNWINDPHGNAYLCDVAIVQPACPSHVSKSQQRLGAANYAALEKHKQYDAMANADGAKMWPLIAEVYGALDQDFVTFIKRMGYFAGEDDGCPWSQHEVVSQMYGSIAVAIQKGNVQTLDAVQHGNRRAGLIRPQRRDPNDGSAVGVSAAVGSVLGSAVAVINDDDMSLLHEGGRRVRGAARVIIPHALQVNSVDESDEEEEDSVNEVEPRLPGDHLVGDR